MEGRLTAHPARRGTQPCRLSLSLRGARPRGHPGLRLPCTRQTVFASAAGNGNPAGGGTGVLVPGPASQPTGGAAALSPQPLSSAPAPPPSECSAPNVTYQKLVAIGAAKAVIPLHKAVLLSLMAGAFISFGGMMVLAVGANCPGLAAQNPGLQKLIAGAFGLPLGLILVLLTGAELFTGNTMLLTLAVLEGLATPIQLLRSWAVSFTGNLVGSIAVVSLVSISGLLAAPSATNVAAAKTSLTFVQAFTRGVIANWLVCLAVWLATAASSFPGKALGAWFPVSAFAATGAEHSVANMFSIPMGIAIGADVSWGSFFTANLLPVVLGNIVSGSFFVAVAFCACYGRLSGANK